MAWFYDQQQGVAASTNERGEVTILHKYMNEVGSSPHGTATNITITIGGKSYPINRDCRMSSAGIPPGV